ncbi:MAG TPA: SDR family oxidoreductase, partial [Anaerolineaceae bacterium]
AAWQAAAPLARLGQPEEVADACLFLASPMARWITGIDLLVDGGISARSLF